MPRLLRKLRNIALVLLLVAGLGVLAGWWAMRASLPQLDGAVSLPELKQEVIVDRDALGVPTIRASSMEDLVTAQGYVMAQDRLWQMDVIRRAAAGELSEIFGEATLDVDRQMRVLSLRQAAEASLPLLSEEVRRGLEGYARGVNRFIEQHPRSLPWEFLVLRYRPRPWTPLDSLLIHGYMYNVLSSSWQEELARGRLQDKVAPEILRELFVVDSPLDHVVVGAHASGEKPTKAPAADPGAARMMPGAALLSAERVLDQFARDSERVLGSNNWVVNGSFTYSGKPILANDTHLPNDVPSIWYMLHLKAAGYNAKGFALPGGPLVVIGHNERIAWGFTNNGADVQDLYIETFNPANPAEYRVNGEWVPATVRKESIRVKGGDAVTLDVVVTRHGPIVHREAGRAYALRWTALEPGALGASYTELGMAQNWQEFLSRAGKVSGPAQNAVYADVDGNIGYVLAAWVPVRKKGDGSAPVPGDTDDYEWSGHIAFDDLPKVLNPPSGLIASANARVVGPGYKPYLTDRWFSPYRTDRIHALLEGKKGLRPAECIAMQTDLFSAPHLRLAAMLVEAAKQAQPKDPRVSAMIGRLQGWSGRADAASPEMAFVDYTWRDLRREILRGRLGEAAADYRWSRSMVFFERVLAERPGPWLPKQYSTYDALLMASADRAVASLEQDTRARGTSQPEAPASWRWGQFVRLRMLHPMGRSGVLRSYLSMPDHEQNGTGYSVKQTGATFGPAMRFVADLADWDNSLMNITTGQSGHVLSRHYGDQFAAWFEGRGVPSAFSDAAEEKTRAHGLVLVPNR